MIVCAYVACVDVVVACAPRIWDLGQAVDVGLRTVATLLLKTPRAASDPFVMAQVGAASTLFKHRAHTVSQRFSPTFDPKLHGTSTIKLAVVVLYACVLDQVSGAEALFFAGGDQSNYVGRIAGKPLEALVRGKAAHVTIGGTSAGLAIQVHIVVPRSRDERRPGVVDLLWTLDCVRVVCAESQDRKPFLIPYPALPFFPPSAGQLDLCRVPRLRHQRPRHGQPVRATQPNIHTHTHARTILTHALYLEDAEL